MAQGPATTKADWKESGRAWGARALDWAYLFEPYARPANEVLFDRLDVRAGVRLLDIACGSGLAASYPNRLGAQVSGLDASDALIQIARERTPGSDFRVGDMSALPFADASFDVATSFNGIWKGCEAALNEARRVLRPAGRLGLTQLANLDKLPITGALIVVSPLKLVGGTGSPSRVFAFVPKS